MVSPVHHPVTPNQTENVVNQTAVRGPQKPAAKPQPVQDSVNLSRTSETIHDSKSK